MKGDYRMNRTSKGALIAGMAVQSVSLLLFFLRVRPLTGMSLLCLCFLLFAELEFFGGIAALAQYARDRLPPFLRAGIGILSGVYTALSAAVSLTFLPMGNGAVKAFLALQLLLLFGMLFLDFLLALASRRARSLFRKTPPRKTG